MSWKKLLFSHIYCLRSQVIESFWHWWRRLQNATGTSVRRYIKEDETKKEERRKKRNRIFSWKTPWLRSSIRASIMIGDEPAGILRVGRESRRAGGWPDARSSRRNHSLVSLLHNNDNGVHPDQARSQPTTGEIHKQWRTQKFFGARATVAVPVYT